ncbi:MAG: serine/threonine protein phosphatase [Clostridiales bacterium]|jgi:predicted phosphohydrolase|nr:serine/threonine protein phosphatase [Clostridiales bacterium]
MAIYAIGDLHLSLDTDKPMDVFGGGWDNYVIKIKEGFSVVGPSDTCVICGDVTWSKSLEDSLEDFKFIDSLPGKKIILKGNHDYWWSTVSKIKAFFGSHDIRTIEILHNNCFVVNQYAVCGTRGWFYEEEKNSRSRSDDAHDRKIMAREIMRLETSLMSADAFGIQEKICFLHYPPVFRNYICLDFIDMMKKYGVRECWYGHIHGQGQKFAVTGEFEGIAYHLVSADYINFTPVRVR